MKMPTSRKNPTKGSAHTPKGQVRIIGGKWRGRKLSFSSLPQLRPTPDRVRETLFNWLSPAVVGAHCLDLFAGSGALGFEALSRGADSVVMVDKSSQLVKELASNAKLLTANKELQLYCAAVPEIQLPEKSIFDIVFLDPPFRQNWLPVCYQWLASMRCLAPEALIYVEAESSLQPLPLPENAVIIRQKIAGQVGYYLVRKLPPRRAEEVNYA